MRIFLIVTDTIIITICIYSLIGYINAPVFEKVALCPAFVMGLKLGALICTKFHKPIGK